MQILMLSPEPPYPLEGGGAFRIASLLNYFARFAQVDLILLSNSGEPALLPPGLVRSQQVIPLAHHNRGLVARYARNGSRAIRGVPPLIDRLAGLSASIERAIGGRRYDLAVVEHFWCAPYVDLLSKFCEKTVLDLHNIESVLHERCSVLSIEPGNGVSNAVSENLIRAGHRRFAAASRRLESALLPRFSAILATSSEDAGTVLGLAPRARVCVYPNSLPWVDRSRYPEHPHPARATLVFSANFEYHPNIDAVRFLVGEIWPELKKLRPELRLRLVGRGDRFIRHLLPAGSVETTGIEVTGPVPDALAEIAQAQIVVAPLRAGSGTRIKILEAWAAGRCVVATPLAAEGLAAQDGVNIALEQDPARFAARVALLLNDSAARQSLGAVGRRTFEDRYSWETAWKKLDIDLQLRPQSALDGYTGDF
jgi:glycosyltransferase involved in cell wall biosynthesis